MRSKIISGDKKMPPPMPVSPRQHAQQQADDEEGRGGHAPRGFAGI
jgi:hypothetical protein